MKTQLFTNRVMNIMMPAMMLIMNCVTVMIIWFGGHGIDAGTMQVGDMIAFITYTMQIVMAFLMITMISVMLPRAGVAADRIQEVLDTPLSIHDAASVRDEELKDAKGELRFEDVSSGMKARMRMRWNTSASQRNRARPQRSSAAPAAENPR